MELTLNRGVAADVCMHRGQLGLPEWGYSMLRLTLAAGSTSTGTAANPLILQTG